MVAGLFSVIRFKFLFPGILFTCTHFICLMPFIHKQLWWFFLNEMCICVCRVFWYHRRLFCFPFSLLFYFVISSNVAAVDVDGRKASADVGLLQSSDIITLLRSLWLFCVLLANSDLQTGAGSPWCLSLHMFPRRSIRRESHHFLLALGKRHRSAEFESLSGSSHSCTRKIHLRNV